MADEEVLLGGNDDASNGGDDKEVTEKEAEKSEGTGNWYDDPALGLEDAWKADPNITTKKSVAEAIKDLHNLQKVLGKKGMPKPETDDPAEWDAYYKYGGKPDTPDQYGIDDPESPFADEGKKAFLAGMHEAGLNKKQAQTMYSKVAGMFKTSIAAQGEAVKASREKAFNSLAVDLGGADKAKEYIAEVNSFLKNNVEQKYPGFLEVFTKAVIPGTNEPLANHPLMAKVIGMLSEPYKDDKRKLGGTPAKSADDAEKELQALYVEIANTSDRDDSALAKLQDRRMRLEKSLYVAE